jgi:hypothetical protein
MRDPRTAERRYLTPEPSSVVGEASTPVEVMGMAR